MIRDGKKVRRSVDVSGYVFSYDGKNASMITDAGVTLTDIKPIDDLVIVDPELWVEVDSFNMDIVDFMKRVSPCQGHDNQQ